MRGFEQAISKPRYHLMQFHRPAELKLIRWHQPRLFAEMYIAVISRAIVSIGAGFFIAGINLIIPKNKGRWEKWTQEVVVAVNREGGGLCRGRRALFASVFQTE